MFGQNTNSPTGCFKDLYHENNELCKRNIFCEVPKDWFHVQGPQRLNLKSNAFRIQRGENIQYFLMTYKDWRERFQSRTNKLWVSGAAECQSTLRVRLVFAQPTIEQIRSRLSSHRAWLKQFFSFGVLNIWVERTFVFRDFEVECWKSCAIGGIACEKINERSIFKKL